MSKTMLDQFISVENPEGLGYVIKFEGYTSTSLDRDIALGFLDKRKREDEKRVLFEILWKREGYHF